MVKNVTKRQDKSMTIWKVLSASVDRNQILIKTNNGQLALKGSHKDNTKVRNAWRM